MKKFRKILTIFLSMSLLLAGCGSSNEVRLSEPKQQMSVEDAKQELEALLSDVTVHTVKEPVLDIYMDEIGGKAALGDIDAFDITVNGTGAINIEIAAATELTSEAPDDWITVVAKNFNREGMEIDGRTVSVTIRQITSGEIVTYVAADAYQPNVIIPSNEAWGEMLEASGVGINKIESKLVGNTAGILMSSEKYDEFINKYKELTVGNVLQAALAKDITFAYTNPYTSSTGLNMLTAMLKDFDENDPLSDKASEALLEYQKTSPPVAYTTAVLRNQAKKGIIDTMVMEEQAYIKTPELKDCKYVPFGIRHDHPVYTFDWNSAEENEAAKLFVDYCKNKENQQLASDKGFNRSEDYKSQDPGLSGQDYLTAQSLWKQNKNGGRPIVAVFVSDVSGSMAGEKLVTLQNSIINTLPYINDGHYVGLVSYSDDVTINLPIDEFTDKQRAYFSGEMKNLHTHGGTCTYDAVLVGLDMLMKKVGEVPDAIPLMFVLTDGETYDGYSLYRISDVVDALDVPIYTIAYDINKLDELEELSGLNEAATIRADTDDIVNQLRNLFTTQL